MEYYCLTLKQNLTNLEAVEEIFREQQAYDKRFSSLSSRSGYIFTMSELNNLPHKFTSSFRNSSSYKIAKFRYFHSISKKTKSLNDFVFVVSTNEQFLTWVTLKLVEVENNFIKNNQNKEFINYSGFIDKINI
jgi:hypothetical protein